MKCGARIALGVAGGYFLGRTKKMKLALMLAGMAAGRQAGGPAALLSQGKKLLDASPELARLTDEVGGRLLEAGKDAALAVAARQVESLTDRVAGRVESSPGNLGERGRPPKRSARSNGDRAADVAGEEVGEEVGEDRAADVAGENIGEDGNESASEERDVAEADPDEERAYVGSGLDEDGSPENAAPARPRRAESPTRLVKSGTRTAVRRTAGAASGARRAAEKAAGRPARARRRNDNG